MIDNAKKKDSQMTTYILRMSDYNAAPSYYFVPSHWADWYYGFKNFVETPPPPDLMIAYEQSWGIPLLEDVLLDNTYGLEGILAVDINYISTNIEKVVKYILANPGAVVEIEGHYF